MHLPTGAIHAPCSVTVPRAGLLRAMWLGVWGEIVRRPHMEWVSGDAKPSVFYPDPRPAPSRPVSSAKLGLREVCQVTFSS